MRNCCSFPELLPGCFHMSSDRYFVVIGEMCMKCMEGNHTEKDQTSSVD